MLRDRTGPASRTLSFSWPRGYHSGRWRRRCTSVADNGGSRCARTSVMRYRADVHVDDAARRRALAEDVRRGLGAREKWLPPKYFYDAAGSALFERITQLPEYYLTRAEHALLDAHAAAILAASGPREIVELGAGSPAKVLRLLAGLNGTRPLARYVPVDVDGSTLDVAGRTL